MSSMNVKGKYDINQLVRPEIIKNGPVSNQIFNEHIQELISSGRDIVHFAFGMSPFPIPNCFVEELRKNSHIRHYLPMTGLPELKEALSEFHLKYDGVHLDKDNFIPAPGSKEILYMLMNVFEGTILIPSPAWTAYEPQAYLAGKEPVIVATDRSLGWKVTPESLDQSLQFLDTRRKEKLKLLIITNPGNPTGTCYTEKEIVNLSSYCRRNDIIVLSDEIYARLTFKKNYHTSMLKHYPEGTILCTGFSKWPSTGGWRLGYAYVPSQLQPLFHAIKSTASQTFSCAPSPMQYAAANAMREHDNELKEYMDDCSVILDWVGTYCYRELLSVGVAGHQSEAGYYYMPDFKVIRRGLAKKGIYTSKQMVDAILKEVDVALMSSDYFLRPSSELTVRFCFVCFDGSKALEDLRAQKASTGGLLSRFDESFVRRNCQTVVEGIERLKKFVNKYKTM